MESHDSLRHVAAPHWSSCTITARSPASCSTANARAEMTISRRPRMSHWKCAPPDWRQASEVGSMDLRGLDSSSNCRRSQPSGCQVSARSRWRLVPRLLEPKSVCDKPRPAGHRCARRSAAGARPAQEPPGGCGISPSSRWRWRPPCGPWGQRGQVRLRGEHLGCSRLPRRAADVWQGGWPNPNPYLSFRAASRGPVPPGAPTGKRARPRPLFGDPGHALKVRSRELNW